VSDNTKLEKQLGWKPEDRMARDRTVEGGGENKHVSGIYYEKNIVIGKVQK